MKKQTSLRSFHILFAIAVIWLLLPLFILMLFNLGKNLSPDYYYPYGEIGGCFDDTHTYGWPVRFLEITWSCATCCLETATYPHFSLLYIELVIDSLYYAVLFTLLFIALRSRYKAKKKAKELKNTTMLRQH